MTARDYKAYIYQPGSTSLSTSNVDFVVGIAALAEVPVVRGGTARVLEGRVEASPFDLLVQDSTASGFISHLAGSDGRLSMINRFVQVRRADSGSTTYTAIGGGRLTDLTNTDNIAQWKVTVSQEWPMGATCLLFTTNTTHLYPPCADPGGTRVGFWGNPYRYGYARLQRCTASSSAAQFAHPARWWQVTFRNDNPPMNQLGWDAIAADHSQYQTGARGGQSTAGAFRYVRFNVGGTDYKVMSFQSAVVVDGNTHQYVPGLNPIADDATINSHITKMAPLTFWVAASSTAFHSLASTGVDARAASYDHDNPFLHMMGAPPSANTPLHIWSASTVIVGTHPMQVLKDILAGSYSHSTTPYQLPLYSTASFTGTNDLRRLPLERVGYRITAPVPMQDWVQTNLCAPFGVLPTQDGTGAVRFKNFRLPVASTTSTGYSTGALFQFTASNLRAPHPDWRANRAEACTQIDLTFQNYGLSASNNGTIPSADGADNIKAWQRSTSLYHDRLLQMGTYAKPFQYLGRPAQLQPLNVGLVNLGTMSDLTSVLARNVFNRFGDGPVQGTLHALENAATVAPGDVVAVKLATYPNLATNARGGTRVVQVVSKSVLPDGYDFDYLDVGAAGAASTRPSITLARTSDYPKNALQYTITNVPTSGSFTAYLARTSGSAPAQTSTLWHPIYSAKGNGTFVTPGLPSGTYFWARANVQQPGKVGSLYAVSTAKVTTSGISAPTGYKTSNITANQAASTWVVGDARYPVALYVDNSTAASPSTANRVAQLDPGSQKYRLSGLDSTTKHRVWVRHYDMFGGYSQSASSTFTTPSSGVSANIILPPPAGLFTIVGTSV